MALLRIENFAAAQKPELRVYFEAGDTMEQITDQGLTLTVTHRDRSKENWVWIYVSNRSKINLIPGDISYTRVRQKTKI